MGKALAFGGGEAVLGEEIGGAIVHRHRVHGAAAAVGVKGDGKLHGILRNGTLTGDRAGEGAAVDLAVGVIGHGAVVGPAVDLAVVGHITQEGAFVDLAVGVIGHGALIGPACKHKVVDHVPVESSVGNIRGLVVHRAVVENAASDTAIIEDHIAVERAVFNIALAGDGVVERTAADGGHFPICHIAGKAAPADGAAGVVGHGSLEGPAGDKAQGRFLVIALQRIAILVQRFLIDHGTGKGPVFNDCAVVGHGPLKGAAGDLALAQVSVATRVVTETGFIRHRTGERAAGDGGCF